MILYFITNITKCNKNTVTWHPWKMSGCIKGRICIINRSVITTVSYVPMTPKLHFLLHAPWSGMLNLYEEALSSSQLRNRQCKIQPCTSSEWVFRAWEYEEVDWRLPVPSSVVLIVCLCECFQIRGMMFLWPLLTCPCFTSRSDR